MNTYRFLAQISQICDDYLKLQEQLFDNRKTDELYAAAKLYWENRK